jgi:hypothetical protein
VRMNLTNCRKKSGLRKSRRPVPNSKCAITDRDIADLADMREEILVGQAFDAKLWTIVQQGV